jgi:hypothetical protein
MQVELGMESVLRLQLERAIARNAAACVVLRHQAANLHRLTSKHDAGWWAKCQHVDCRAVRTILHEGRA